MSNKTRAFFALLLLSAAFSSGATIWFGDKDGLHRVDTSTNRIDLDIDSSEPRALAVNAADGSVWSLTRSRITKYSADGIRLFDRTLDSLADGTGDGQQLALNAADGSAWVAGKRRLLHLRADGSLRTAIQGGLTDLAVAQDGTLWVLDEDELRRYADEGGLLSRTRLEGASRKANYIALDDTRGALWLGSDRAIIKRSLSNPGDVLRSVTTPEKVGALSLDVQTGELWVLGSASFHGYSSDGTRFASEHMDRGVSDPETLAFDIGTQAIWVGHRRGLARFTRNGDRVATLRADEVDTVAVSRVAVAIDPAITLVAPAPDALLNNARPTIVFQYGAACAGVPCTFPPSYFASFSINAILNGNAIGTLFTFDPATGQTRYTPPTPLPQGTNQVSGQAVDAAGHTSPTTSAQFTIDTVAPQFMNVTPASGSVFTTAQVTIQGSTDDASARVRLAGANGDAPSNFSFPVTLATGISSFTLTATDPAGNATPFPLTYTFNPPNTPPAVSITAPANGTTFTAPASFSITANASDPDGSIQRVDFRSNGSLIGSDATAPYAASVTSLPAGTYVLTAVATDNRDAATTSAPVTVTVGPPNAPPTVSLVSPANGATFTEPASIRLEASAGDSDGTVNRVEFLRNGLVIATITTPPYQFTLTGVVAGTFAFSARAVDNANASTTSAVATVTVAAGPPNAPPTVKITSPSPGTSYSAPASVRVVASANDTDGTIARVEFFRNGLLAQTVTAPPFEATLTGIPAGNHSLTARATDDRGAGVTSAPVSITATTLALTITSPAPGEAIAGDSVLVTGSFTGLPNSGVVVGDVIASVDASQGFFAIAPLAAGSNTIVVTLTGPDGVVTSQSVTVNAAGQASPFSVVAQPALGLAPLAVIFNVTNPTAASATFTFDGAGPFALPAGATAQLGLTYPAGVFAPTIVFNSAGATYTQRLVIESRDPAAIDALLRSIWSGMNQALAAGDRDGALRPLNSGAKSKYGPVFDALMPFMGEIVASWSPLAASSLTSRIGEYAVSRIDGGKKRLYMIYFLQDADGVWRIDEM